MKSYSTLNKLYFINILSKNLIESNFRFISYIKNFFIKVYQYSLVLKSYIFLRDYYIYLSRKLKKLFMNILSPQLLKNLLLIKFFVF